MTTSLQVAVLEDNGEIVSELQPFYVTKEQFLKDYERLIMMISDGPL